MTARSSLAAAFLREVSVRDIPRPRLLTGAISLAVLASVLAPRLDAAGSPMDEGGVLAYADRILHGQVPMRDLHSFYGPLSTYLVAGVFRVVDPSLGAERAIGLTYRLVLAAVLLALVRRRGPGAIVAASLLLLWLLPSQGVAAYATYGALAIAYGAILLADNERPFAAGAAAGVALLMRFDFVLAIVLAAVPYLWAWSWPARRRLILGGVAGAFAYVPYLAFVGPAKLHVFVVGVRTGQAGRHLPVSFAPHGRGFLLDAGLLAILVLAAIGIRRRRTAEGLLFLSVALASAGLLPYAFDRTDKQHILVAVIPPIVVLAAAVPAAVTSRRVRTAAAVAAAVAAVAFFATDPFRLADLNVWSSSLGSGRAAASVTYGGRSFRLDASFARAAQQAVVRAAQVAPVNGSLFVGPGDLRVTSYADAYMYFLLPQLKPATFYITLDPGSTNLPGEGLDGQLERADVLVLNDEYDPASATGAAGPNRIVARDFCLRGTFQPFRVYVRCRASAGAAGNANRRPSAGSHSA
ncbi:MAG TPA: hypothetical protein VFW85_02335 [Gaiellaceae bacterium]|nr:hypothetical protein [Gaiellaceae bacterium]